MSIVEDWLRMCFGKEPSISHTWTTADTGYVKSEDPMVLKDICDSVIADPDFAPVKDSTGHVCKTFCNCGARRVAQALECREFDDLNLDAEAMIDIMEKNASGRWRKVDGVIFSANAIAGKLGFACMRAKQLRELHAHIASGYPAPMVMSGSLGHLVPAVANVGQTNKEEAESLAFPPADGEATYFVYS